MRAKVVLLARIRDEDGSYPFIPVEIKRGSPVPVEEATAYYLRYSQDGKRVVEPVGTNLTRAFVAYQNRQLAFDRARIGLPAEAKTVQGRVRIVDAVQIFLEDNADKLAKGKLRKKSVAAYDVAAIDFRDSINVSYMDEITREVLLGHETWLYRNLGKRNHGKQQNTVAGRFRCLNIFLNRYGIQMVKKKEASNDEGLLRRDEAPKTSEKEVDAYSPDEIQTLMGTATTDEADMIQFFLKLGVRDEEVAYAKWSDIKTVRENSEILHVFHVQEKPEFGWRPKSGKSRKIDINEKLYERLMARMERQPKSDLIFPNGMNAPDMHLIRRLQKAWERAGLPGRPELHKFRRTFITGLLAQGVPPQDVMNYSGHTDYKSFQRYMAKDRSQGRKGLRKMSEVYGD
jgi:integrase